MRFLAILLALLPEGLALANDSAVSVAAGGLQPKLERRISMRKERLYVGAPGSRAEGAVDKVVVRVDYEFQNEDRADVVTDVAFPLPRYRFPGDYPLAVPKGLRTWVDGRTVAPKKLVRAFVGEREVTKELTALSVSIDDFGGFALGDESRNIWGPDRKQKLVSLGALDGSGWPAWTVEVTYYWSMTFPAGRPVLVRHEYVPVVGFKDLGDTLPADGCFDEAAVKARAKGREHLRPSWVDYILTTANSWKTPISEFELVVERPPAAFASFCWDGKVEKVGPTTFSAKVRDFVPTRELRVYFF